MPLLVPVIMYGATYLSAVSFGSSLSLLRPVPPVESKHQGVRYFDIHEGDRLDEKLVAGWIRQAARLPGAEWF